MARAKGQPGPAISAARAARYEKLESLLAELPATPGAAMPREGWQDRVLAAIDAEEAGVMPAATGDGVIGFVRRKRGVLVGIVGVAAAAAVVWALLGHDRPELIAMAPVVRASVETSGEPRRSMGAAVVGDTLVARATVDGPAELRVYNASQKEVARCATTTNDCKVARVGARTEISLRVRLDSRGTYTSMVFSPPLGGPSEGLDLDTVKASRAEIATGRDNLGPVQ